jgi:hypothetical protein
VDTQPELQGRRIAATEMSWLQFWIGKRPQWSRKQTARELCRRWQWIDGRGRMKDFAARSLLLKLEARGAVKLPALRLYHRRPIHYEERENASAPLAGVASNPSVNNRYGGCAVVASCGNNPVCRT